MTMMFSLCLGLSKEGWSISKNMWTEILIVVIGLFTFVSAVQVSRYRVNMVIYR